MHSGVRRTAGAVTAAVVLTIIAAGITSAGPPKPDPTGDPAPDDPMAPPRGAGTDVGGKPTDTGRRRNISSSPEEIAAPEETVA